MLFGRAFLMKKRNSLPLFDHLILEVFSFDPTLTINIQISPAEVISTRVPRTA
jgi:hypothetical protein